MTVRRHKEGLRRDGPWQVALARCLLLWQASPRRGPHRSDFSAARRCRSSVVEHPLGKGEVVSSILTGSTTKRPGKSGLFELSGFCGQVDSIRNEA